MNAVQFDRLTRSWVCSRRLAVRVLAAIVVPLAKPVGSAGAEMRGATSCRRAGAPCNSGAVCCSGACAERLREKTRHKRRRWIGRCNRCPEDSPVCGIGCCGPSMGGIVIAVEDYSCRMDAEPDPVCQCAFDAAAACSGCAGVSCHFTTVCNDWDGIVAGCAACGCGAP